MGTHRKALLHDLPTPVALLRREAGRNFHNLMTSSCSLLSKYLDKRSPGGISNALRQMLVLEHAVDVQVFDADASRVLSIRLGRLEEEVAPLALDLQMGLCHVARRFAPSLTALLASAESALLPSERSLALAIIPRIGNGLSLGIRQEDFQADIQPNVRMGTWLAAFMGLFCLRWFADYERVPVSIGAQNKMAGLRHTSNGPVQLDLQQQTNLARDTQMLAIFMQAEIFLMLAQLNAMPAIGGLEAGKAARDPLFFAGEMPSEGFIQPISEHLDSCSRDALAPTSSKARGQFILEEKTACVGILLPDCSQHLVIQTPRILQARHQLLALGLIGVQTVFKRSHTLIIGLEQPYCQEQQGG